MTQHLSASECAAFEDTFPWSKSSNFDHESVVGAVKSLLSEEYVETKDLSTNFCALTEEGKAILENGSHEVLVFKAVVEAGNLSRADLEAKVGKKIAGFGMGKCMKAKWIKTDGGGLVPLKKVDEVVDKVQEALKALADKGFSPDALSPEVRLYRRFLGEALFACRPDFFCITLILF